MRTKVLICAAALVAASAFTSMAQNVYSLNVVGYVNIPLVEQYNLIANQLDYDGTGQNNTTVNILGTNLPVNTAVYTWSGTGWNIATFAHTTKSSSSPVVWSQTNTLNPGQGAWLYIPSGGLAGTSSNLTTVGQVDQGSLVNPNVIAGNYSLLSSMVPLAGGLQTTLNYTPKPNDVVYQWELQTNGLYNWTINSFVKATKSATNYTWTAEPQIAVGQGFWLDNASGGASWSNYFVVPQQ